MVRIEGYKEDIFCELLDFGGRKGNEFVTPNSDGSYTIFINSRISFDAQRKALKHAIFHIEHHDFEKQDVQAIESYAHAIAKQKEEQARKETAEQRRKQMIEEVKKRTRERRLQDENRKYLMEMKRHEDFMNIYMAINPNYVDAIIQKYYDPDDPVYKF